MSSPPTPPPRKRPTVRMIAEQAGVSASTVSMALRHLAKIPAETRERVERVAKELGYRPDPEITKLMVHLGARTKPRYRSTIVALTTYTESTDQPYGRALLNGARQRADALGYGLDLVRFEAVPGRNRMLERMLSSRGIEGLLLLPMQAPVSLAELLDWDQFSVVAATNGVLAPEFSRVVPHHYGNTLSICQHLTELGYARIGLVMKAQHERVVAQGLTSAAIWRYSLGQKNPVAPLLHESETLQSDELRDWFKAERPDAIIVAGVREAENVVRELALTVPGPVAVVVNNLQGETSLFAGSDGHPEEIASTAIDLLHARVQTGQKGVPLVPSETLIRSTWVHGPSLEHSARK